MGGSTCAQLYPFQFTGIAEEAELPSKGQSPKYRIMTALLRTGKFNMNYTYWNEWSVGSLQLGDYAGA